MDYLVEVPNEAYEELFDQRKANQEADNLHNYRQQRTHNGAASLFSNSQNLDTLEDSFLQYRSSVKDKKTNNEIKQNEHHHNGFSREKNYRAIKDNQTNLKTLVEKIPVFEEELQENV